MASIRGRRQKLFPAGREQELERRRECCVVIKHCRGLNKWQLPPPEALEEKPGARTAQQMAQTAVPGLPSPIKPCLTWDCS